MLTLQTLLEEDGCWLITEILGDVTISLSVFPPLIVAEQSCKDVNDSIRLTFSWRSVHVVLPDAISRVNVTVCSYLSLDRHELSFPQLIGELMLVL